MKKTFYFKFYLMLMLMLPMMLPLAVQARPDWASEYFENPSYFDAYAMGNGRIHVKVLIFAVGGLYDFNAGIGNPSDLGDGQAHYLFPSRVSYVVPTGSHRFIEYGADNHYNRPYTVAGRPLDMGWIRFRVTDGSIVVTNEYYGTNPSFTVNDGWIEVDLKRDATGDFLTYLEFDWYPSETLNGVEFDAVVTTVNHRSGEATPWNTREYNLGTFYGADMDQQPQLMDPVFYPVTSEGGPSIGNLTIPYVSFQQVYQYYTSWNSTSIPCTEQGGMLSVASADSVQHGFYITMQTKNSRSNADVVLKQWLRSNKVNIPAYHKIYDFTVGPYIWGGVPDNEVDPHVPCGTSEQCRYTLYLTDTWGDGWNAGGSLAVRQNGNLIATLVMDSGSLDSLVLYLCNNVEIQFTWFPGNFNYESGFYVVDHNGYTVFSKENLPNNIATYSFTPNCSSYLECNNYQNPRFKKLSWKIRLPYEEDIMVTDMFELQRAYDSSFADAQTIATIPMSWDVTDSLPALTYTYVDSSFADMNSTPVTGDSVYYRVRRASSSVWGWNHPYAGHGSSKMENRLVSIQASECKFSKDPDFDNNRKVNLTIALADVLSGSPRIRKSYWDDNATLYIKKVLVESGDTILIRVPTESITHAIDSAFFRPCDESSDGTVTVRYTDILNTPCNHVEYFYYIDTAGTSLRQTAADIENYGNVAQTRHFLRIGGHPYFTDAGNLNTLEATDGEYPDRVLITWTPTEGNVDDYTVETRPDTASEWTLLGTTTNSYWNDVTADPSVSPEWHYRVTMSYTCQGTTVSDSRTTTGYRSPWGRVSGRVHYEDGSGCPGITVVATRTSDGATVQTAVTDVTGHYMLDSLPYGGNVEYTITPTSQTAQFHYNNTSSGFATVNLSLASCVTTGIDFDNISSVRVTGRVLYENSSVPVHDAGFLLNGNPVSLSGSAVKTDVGGYFEIHAPEGSAFTLQVVKEGHHFASGGFVYINGDSLLTLDAALDGVRVWDQTKVHLAGRVAGGLDQRNLPLGFGLSTNNLGDDLRLVLELEGDNVSNIVLIPNDLTKDTLEFTVPHLVYGQDGVDTVGVTRVHYQQKRIIIEPDPVTGEFCADLFPVRYKIVQATATNYATLFTSGTTSQTLDLGFAAIVQDTIRYGSQYTVSDCQFKLTYRSPINITCQQMVYGMVMPYFGDRYMQRTNIRNEQIQVPLAYKDSTGVYQYLFGAPVFRSGEYSFRAYAHEDYYYNNEPSGRHDEVRIKGGTLKVYNGMHETPSHNTQILTMELDSIGQADFTIPVDYVSFIRSDSSVLRVLDLSVESEGAYVEKQAVRGYITGNRITGSEAITSTHGEVKLLDVLRDPPGSTSSAWLEAGTEYNYSYTYAIDFTFGVDIGFQTGTSLSMTIGAFLGLGSGMFSGQDFNVNQTFQFDIPISTVLHHKHQSSYTFKTSERISTSSDIHWVGQPADVYIGLVQNMYARRVDAVQPIDSLTYATLGAHSATGLMATVAEGVAPDSTRYYLVIGKELEMRPAITSTFAYTHKYIKNDLIPRLVQERDALLLTCDSATAQSIADARHKVVFRSLVPFGDENWAVENYYRAVLPQGFTDEYVNSVDSANRLIADWLTVMLRNEAEKVSAIHYHGHDSLATYSLGNATTVTRTENYSYSDATHTYMDYPGMDMSSLANNVIGVVASKFGQGIADVMDNAFSKTLQNSGGADNESPMTLAQQSPGSSTKFIFKPILDLDFSRDPVQKTIHTRALGFTLSPDTYSNMDVSIYRIVNSRDAYNSGSYAARDGVDGPTDYNINDFLYGSPVFYLRGGATKCPCELADSTEVYVPKMPISAGSLRLENPKVDINVHERSNVPVNSPAVFTLTLYNETEQVTSIDNLPINFKLKMNDQSNPHGAQIYIDGMPLTDGRIFEFFGDQVVTKTMEVYAGDGYDFEDLVIEFGSTCMSTYKSRAQFSVHYIPVSCDVNLVVPHDNWLMNTRSPKDSAGYYLPVVIGGYDVNYRGFDHIELQYKLSTQSDDDWVNLCSYYADSALYADASGNKAMIQGGTIENIRFYGERDPMEQRYDLRAVSFCRYGSGFITKASEIRTGIQDTRCPRVFGEPEPANGILGVGDYLKLRFNEPIAGNYLDEDNNFRLLGVTNRSDIASSTSVYFDGTSSCSAASAVTRVLSDKSFSIDLMAKPASATSSESQELFSHTTLTGGIGFGLEPSGAGMRLYGFIDDRQAHSQTLEPLTDFTRLIMTYDHETGEIRFYAGTQDVTESIVADYELTEYDGSAPLVFGQGYHGNMLEARLWLKALSTDEIVETHKKRLTGYENKLAAYYPMNEGRGDICHDKASGSTLTLQGATWTTPSGYSLQMDGQQAVTLDQYVLSRSDIQDYTLMFWFRTTESDQGLFSAGWTDTSAYNAVRKGTLVEMESGRLVLHNGNMEQHTALTYNDGLWHHFILTVNRTYNIASVYVDGQMTNTFATDSLSGLSGVMVLGGDQYGHTTTFHGHLDDLVIYEQALPKSLIESYDNLTPIGDEMGLVALLTFSEQKENPNGIMEEVFSINNQRIFTLTDGTVVEKVQPLVVSPDAETMAGMGDPNDHAPVRESDKLTKMNFDWSYNNDELLININMQDREINKNSIYITVRNVEDLNGNRTVSPSMWQVYVNKNVLLWNSDGISQVFYEQADRDTEIPVQIMNVSGRRHQYTIDGLPDWLDVNQPYGSLNPQETQNLVFTISEDLSVGVYSEIIYLTDEDDLSEPLHVYIEVRAVCPWEEVSPQEFSHQMSLMGQVVVDGIIDTDPNDVVVAMSDGRIVGYEHISSGSEMTPGSIFMTIYGNELVGSQPLQFRLWQASTGRIFGLTPSPVVYFQSNSLVGLPPADPVLLSTSANEVQNLDIREGWNWISFNIEPNNGGVLNGLFFTAEPFVENTQIKSVATQQFAEWDGSNWSGSLNKVNYRHMYMFYSYMDHYGTQVSGRRLANNSERTINLYPGWNVFPYLLTSASSLTNAMADYIDNAGVGDIIKSQTQFAVFNDNDHWIGSLTTLVPGEGYLLYRNGNSIVPFTFYSNSGSKGMENENPKPTVPDFERPATNMTVIAKIENEELRKKAQEGGTLKAYAGTKLAGVAEWKEVDGDILFFLTIGTDQPGHLRFFLEEGVDKTELFANIPMKIAADHRFGSSDDPVLLTSNPQFPIPNFQAFPTVFTDHVDFVVRDLVSEDVHITICNAAGVTVDEINTLRWTNCADLSAGVYFATLHTKDYTSTIKLVKVKR